MSGTGQTQQNEEVFFFVQPQGPNGETTFFDNINITYGPDCPIGDLNGDCAVNFEDFALLGFNWLTFSSVGDFNSDKEVNYEDFQIFALHWLNEEY